MKLGIYEILDKVNEKTSRKDKVLELRKHDNNEVLKLVLKMSFDKNLRWILPEGPPPYRPSIDFDQQGMFYKEFRRLYLFIEDPRSAHLPPTKREKLFVDLLETLHPRDAEILVGMKEKKLPYKGITEKLVAESFPGLLQ